jgi:hypothetical protein
MAPSTLIVFIVCHGRNTSGVMDVVALPSELVCGG